MKKLKLQMGLLGLLVTHIQVIAAPQLLKKLF